MVIASMKLQGASTRAIARVLARPPSTISRELRRNSSPEAGYASEAAMASHAMRRKAAKPACKLDSRSVTWSAVLSMLSWKWSPQQIAATLRRVFPHEPERHVSHETIYTAIYALAWIAQARTAEAIMRMPAALWRKLEVASVLMNLDADLMRPPAFEAES